MNVSELARGVRAGEPRALARALTAVENRWPEAHDLLTELFPHTGNAMVIGLTGPPGVGKSTLADRLATRARDKGKRVAILATDPTSPFTGGALLGDRVRMEAGSRDPEIFIRSMATRGHVGGLSATAFEAIAVLEASGRDFILVETVGVGQDEVDVAAAAGLTIVVLAPGLGDEIQAAKAGLLEAAARVVVNKADQEGADRLVADLEMVLGAGEGAPRVLQTVATNGEGVPELLNDLEALYLASAAESPVRRRRALEGWLSELVARGAVEKAQGAIWEATVDALVAGSLDPFSAAERVLAALAGGGGAKSMKIHHLGIAVRGLDEAAARFEALLGLARGKRYDLPEWKVSVLFLAVGESHLELLEPHGEDSNVGKFLARRGEGLHHVCFEVEDIEASLRDFERQGAELIDKKPRPGAGGHLVAFVHPKSTHGVLVELKQK